MGFVVALAAALALYNNATNLLGLPDAAYVPANLAAAGLVLAAARSRGYGWATLGVARHTVRGGLRWGAAAAVVVAVALLIAAALPWTRPLLADQRVAGIGISALMWRVLVRIPFGTVLLEELAFRGVLLGAWAEERSTGEAVAGSSLLFGVWHVGPLIRLLQANDVALHAPGAGWAVAGGVLVTAGAGVVFALLRLRTGGVLAPALAHVAANSLATVAAFLAQP